jgi:hypothetical protein
MPGPRLPARRPTVSRFTFRKPQTVAPRNKRNGTATSVAKQLRNLPALKERLTNLSINLRETIDEIMNIYTSNPTNQLALKIIRLGQEVNKIDEEYNIASEFEIKTQRPHKFTEEEMHALMGNTSHPLTEEEIREIMGQNTPKLPGIPEENSNNS